MPHPEGGTFEFREFTLQVVRHQQAIADRLGINLTDFKCLGILHRRGALTPKELIEEMGVSPAAMTTIIDRLEQSGFAKRKREGSDRRSFTVHAREESDKEVTKLYRSLEAAATRLNADYSEQELRLIFGYLQKASNVLNVATSKLLRRNSFNKV
jgi:DNA-binding MarR family transcriptional regulator